MIPQTQPILTMTHIITDTSVIEFTSLLRPLLADQQHVWNPRVFAVQASMPQGDVYTHGVRFHALLSRIKDHGPLSKTERQYLPFLDSLRSELRDHGVRYLRPEQVLSHPQLGRGRCDVLVDGGLKPHGIGELKCVTELPDEVRHADLMQLGRYAAMRGGRCENVSLWGFIAYVSISSRSVRVFAYSDLSALGCSVLDASAA